MKTPFSPTIPAWTICGLAVLLGLWVWQARTDSPSNSPVAHESGISITTASPFLFSQSLNLPAAPKVPETKDVAGPSPDGAPLEKAGQASLPPELKKDEQASLWKALSQARREVSTLSPHEAALPSNDGVRLFAQNPSQKLTARFLDQSIRIESGHIGADWQATFSLPGLPAATGVVNAGTRVEYQRGPVIEWYDNRPDGIEQGFIVTRPLQEKGELRIDVAVEGLTAEPNPEDSSAFTLSDASQVARLSYDKLLAWDATGKELPARMETGMDGISLIVADAGARYPITIDPLITTLEQKLGPAIEPGGSGAPSDLFGFSVALSGDTAVVGATSFSSIGSRAYVFVRMGSNWSQQAKLTASDFGSVARFGFSVALSGDTALIGASGYLSNGHTQGFAYVFVRSGTTWSQQARVFATDGASGDQFGYSVALSGDTALIGAYGDDTTAGGDAGSAYVFTRSGSNWSQQAKLYAADAAAVDLFGTSVALSGETAVIGAYGDNSYTGGAYVFVRSGTTWTQQAKLAALDAAANDRFGYSVALSSETALVGAYGDNSNAGSSYVYVRSGTAWSQQAKLTAAGDAAASDQFGISVALSSDTALIGAWLDDTSAGNNAGSAFVFVRSGTSWSRQAKLTAADAGADDTFGRSVALSGDTALIGADSDDTTVGTNAGSAYVLVRSGSTWSQQTKLNPADAAADDRFAYSVAVFDNTALIGAYRDSTAAAANAGSTYVFVRSGSSWSQQTKLTAADAAAADYFGTYVALSGDTALIGTPGDNSAAGSAYVFVRSGSSWSQQSKLAASSGTGGDYFGNSVALSGDTALIGSVYDTNEAGFVNAGSAYVFVRSGSTWSEQAKLIASDAAADDWFAHSVALSGETALVGAFRDDTPSGSDSGSAYVFVRSGSSWSQQAKLIALDAAADDSFGRSVALSGDTALIGSSHDDTTAGNETGSAYVFIRSGPNWSQQAIFNASDAADGDYFGASVALSGDTALVGANYDNTTAGSDAGSAYIFVRSGFSWSQQIKLTAADGAANDYFGSAVAISGDTALVGAYADDGYDSIGQSVADQGSVYVFRIEGSSVPEIAIEQSGNDFANSSTKSFGSVAVSSTLDLTFSIQNTGNADLDLTGTPKIAVTGSSDFTVTAQPASPITGSSGSSNFTVRFSPTGSGLKTAALSIPNNDDDENPFVINLTGTATTASTLSASTIASSSGLTGDDALPTAIPFNDGVENVLKYAFNMNLAGPDTRSLPPGTGTAGLPAVGLTGSGASTMIRVEFLRRKGSGLIYTPKRSSTLALGSFVAMSGISTVTTINDQWERVVVQESANPETLPQSFAIVEVTIPQ